MPECTGRKVSGEDGESGKGGGSEWGGGGGTGGGTPSSSHANVQPRAWGLRISPLGSELQVPSSIHMLYQ